MIQGRIRSFVQSWNVFWFADRNLYSIAVFRIGIGLTLFGLYLWRQFYVEDFFGLGGMISKETARAIPQEFFKPLFYWDFWPDSWVVYVHVLYLVLLFLLVLGVLPRALVFFAWMIHMGFLQRNFTVAFGADVVGGIFLFYLAFMNSNQRLSVLNFWRENKNTKSDIVSNMFVQIAKVQMCLIYAYTGMEKLRGTTWWDGTAIWRVLANSQMATMDYTFVRFLPELVIVATFLTLLWELYFPVLVWFKKFRLWMLTVGVLFHLGIAVSMGLVAFSFVMLSTYALMLQPEDLKSLAGSFKFK